MQRRCLLRTLASLASVASMPLRAAGPAQAARTRPRLATAWALGQRYQAGWLALQGTTLQVQAALDLPTRAHGIVLDTRARLLVVARRPGDWLLRWAGPGHAPQWRWIEAGRAFNGHAVASADGQRVYTTETDLDSGAGLVGVRDATTLAKQDEWPTGGHDPHALLLAADGSLLVANGGVETRPETGRIKHGLGQMDASLVRLDACRHAGGHAGGHGDGHGDGRRSRPSAGRPSGRALGRWTLPDPRLSIRHLAAAGAGVAVALQAEHDDPVARLNAPVLALFDGQQLRAVAAPEALGGYGGDVALTRDAVFVSCPRAGGLAVWSHGGDWRGLVPLPGAQALATAGPTLWAGGHPGAAQLQAGGGRQQLPAGLRLDNHGCIAPA